MANSHRVFGVTGWKNAGKTTLVAALVEEFTRIGLVVSTIKHAHHAFDIDQEGRDSWKHRQAGATETMLVSSRRWALMHELRDEPEPSLDEILAKMSPCDLVIIEGFKRERHAKIEVIRDTGTPKRHGDPRLWQGDDTILAIASEDEQPDCPLPRMAPGDIAKIARFILRHFGMEKDERLAREPAA